MSPLYIISGDINNKGKKNYLHFFGNNNQDNMKLPHMLTVSQLLLHLQFFQNLVSLK